MPKPGPMLSLAKAIRSFIFTSLAISIPFYLAFLGFSALYTSIVVLVSLGISTLYLYLFTAAKMRIKHKLLLMSGLFSLSLIILYLGNNIYFLLIAMVIGALSFAGRDLTTNQSLEQYTISISIEDQHRKTMMFSVYNFASYASGALASALLFFDKGLSFETIFLIDFILSVLQVAIYLWQKFPELKPKAQKQAISDPEVKRDVKALAALFSVDSLGGGLVNTAIITLWFKVVYHISLSGAGLIFIIVNIVTAISVILSGRLSKNLGLVRTMVYTHLFSNVMLFLVPVFHSLVISELFLYLRQTTSQMDVPPRDSLINTKIPKDARVASNSILLGVRNGMQIPGPGLAGLLFEVFPEGVFFSAALIKIAYDVAFFARYRTYRV